MHVKAISISDRKGIRKNNIDTGTLLVDFGLAGDAHGGDWHRQVSLLAQESIDTMRAKGLDVVAGNFAENITTEGIDLTTLAVGTHLNVGETELVISQLGKICHHHCAIYHQAGDCVMPREGIFAVVRRGGIIRVGDEIQLKEGRSTTGAVIATAESLKVCGGVIREAVMSRWAHAFIRVDLLDAEGHNLGPLLDDLSGRQGIDRVIVYDPEGRQTIGIAGYVGQAILAGRPAATIISHCRTTAEIARL